MANHTLLSPTRIIQIAVSFAFITVLTCCWLALRTPWLGLDLYANTEDDRLYLVGAENAVLNEKIEFPVVLERMNDYSVTAIDLVEEPDLLNSNTAILELFSRQTAIAQIIQGETVELGLLTADGNRVAIAITPQERPISDLPAVFWVQILVGVASFLISMWVWSLRRDNWGVNCFAISGFGILTSACSAAVYSTREIALDGEIFITLSSLNYIGASIFGCAMIAMFLTYPKQIVQPKFLIVPAVVFGVPLALDVIDRHSDFSSLWPETYLPPLIATLEMLTIVVLVGLQWVATKQDPHSRAILKWLGLSIVVCAGTFIALAMLPLTMSEVPQFSQGWMFVCFLLIYIGLAMGLHRHRLFDLDTWAFKIIFYMAALFAFILVDALIIYTLDFDAGYSTGLSILIIGVLYLPLRDMFWRKTVGRNSIESHILFKQIIEVAFTNSTHDRLMRWNTLLQSIFTPLEVKKTEKNIKTARISDDGTELDIPPISGFAAVTLCYSRGGKALFNHADLDLANEIITLMQHAEKSRDAYERGRTEERTRIAQDLHDDIGAGLLTSLHTDDVGDIKSTIRKTLSDMRTVVSDLITGSTDLQQLIAALRHESHLRLEAAGIELNWPLSICEEWEHALDYTTYKNYVSIHREIISNIIIHSKATTVNIVVTGDRHCIQFQVTDNGQGNKPNKKPRANGGNGLRNMQHRIEQIEGTINFPKVDNGYAVRVAFPLT